jgi:hypothetical protein
VFTFRSHLGARTRFRTPGLGHFLTPRH